MSTHSGITASHSIGDKSRRLIEMWPNRTSALKRLLSWVDSEAEKSDKNSLKTNIFYYIYYEEDALIFFLQFKFWKKTIFFSSLNVNEYNIVLKVQITKYLFWFYSIMPLIDLWWTLVLEIDEIITITEYL